MPDLIPSPPAAGSMGDRQASRLGGMDATCCGFAQGLGHSAVLGPSFSVYLGHIP